MDSEGCLYPSSRDNLSTDLGCVLCISSSANFLHVHSTKHVWCMTTGLQPMEMNKLKTTTTARMNKKVKVIFDRGHGHRSSTMWTFLASQDRCQCGGMCSCHIGFYTLRLVTTFGSSTTHIISGLLNRSGTGRCQFIRLLLFEMSLFFLW